jgi:hypothetical protein
MVWQPGKAVIYSLVEVEDNEKRILRGSTAKRSAAHSRESGTRFWPVPLSY